MSLRPARALPRFAALSLAALSLAALAACKPGVEAPTAQGVCWQMIEAKGRPPRFAKVADHVPRLENCMGNLEAIRSEMLRAGGSRSVLKGAYQGRFIAVRPDGIYSSTRYGGDEYIALVRSGDGRLVMPGALPQ